VTTVRKDDTSLQEIVGMMTGAFGAEGSVTGVAIGAGK